MERKEIYESPVIEEIDIEESFSFGMPLATPFMK